MTDLATWLATLGLEKYRDAFVANEVDLAALFHLTDQDLKELGLPLGPRRKILAAIDRGVRASSQPDLPADLIPEGERRVHMAA